MLGATIESVHGFEFLRSSGESTMASRTEMIDFIIRNADPSADQGAIAQYYQKKSEDEVRVDYQHLLQGERQRIVAADTETQKAIQQAAAATAETARELNNWRWLQICQTVVNGRTVQNNQANRTEISSWPDPSRGDVFGPELLLKALRDTPSLSYRLSWEPAVDYSPAATKARDATQEAETRQVFRNICRQYNYAFSEANIAIVLQAFPDGCTPFQLEQAVAGLNLHAASESEVQGYTSELITEHNRKWSKKSISDLKKFSTLEREEREEIFNRVTPKPSASGVTPLPAAITKEILLEKLNSADRFAISVWKNRYSMQAINERLNGVS
jgi:hypothetical protein